MNEIDFFEVALFAACFGLKASDFKGLLLKTNKTLSKQR